MRFVRITPEMTEMVIQHLRDSFFADEPLNKSVQLCERGNPHPALEQMCKATIADGLSLAAMEDKDIFKADATGAFSQRICRQFGMKVIGRIRYDEYLDNSGEPVFNVEEPHVELAIMILDLR
ncbi:unnamed protein product [Diatraea saccharalis]|uniref:Uncharacterized protein n=1 Tax=Diatraea saccharalis TaxID=40085 RepID=A0A9N9R219_9NEOP|nr:unnamed protein product [Diatraea saccharalis]